MYCPQCGTAVRAGSRFCTKCGSRVLDDPQHNATDAQINVETSHHQRADERLGLVIICVVLLCAVVCGIWMLLAPAPIPTPAAQENQPVGQQDQSSQSASSKTDETKIEQQVNTTTGDSPAAENNAVVAGSPKAEDSGSSTADGATAGSNTAEAKNPTHVDGSRSAVTLKGTLVREEWPTSKTSMAWSAVGYFLEFDTPVTVTYLFGSEPQTDTVTRLQVASVEQYASNADVNLSSQTDPYWEQFVGSRVAINGMLMNQGNAHCLAKARFDDPTLVETL